MNRIVLALSMVMMGGSLIAFASPISGQQTSTEVQKKSEEKVPTEVACAVMKDEKANVKAAVKAGLFSDYKGRRYVFCCPGCKPAFDKDPAKYAKTAKSIPIPATPKTISCIVMPDDPTNVAEAIKDGRFADYKGTRYVFCCPGCSEKFAKDPAKYADPEKGVPIPEKKAAAPAKS